MSTITTARQPVTIKIRAEISQRDPIDQAAKRPGRSRSAFMLDAACRQAEDVLLDQTCFALDAKDVAVFQKLLDQPPPPSERLRRTLPTRAPWATDPTTAALEHKPTRPRQQ